MHPGERAGPRRSLISSRRLRLVMAKECGTRMPMRSQTALNWFLSFSTATASASSVQHAQPSGSTSSAASASYTLRRAAAH